LNPRNSAAYNNLGNLLLKTGSPQAAVEAFHKALALEPKQAELHNNLGNAFKECGRIDEALESYSRTIRKFKNYAEAHSNLLFCLHYSVLHDARAIRDAHVRWNQDQAKHLLPSQLKHPNQLDPERPLRIGYVSADFRNHPVARFLLPLFENHDKKLFEIYGFMCSREQDHETSRFQTLADHWHDISSTSDEEVSSLIRRNQIDVLVDLALHSAGNRMLVFARKPAPVQVTWLAYAGTSGLNTMDYRISDPYLDSPESDGSEYTEFTLRLPHTFWCYQPALEINFNALPLSSNGYVTFGCFNNFCKINQNVLKLWAELLARLPHSRLHLHAPPDDEVRSRILDCLRVDPTRVRFFSKTSLGSYFDQFRGIDIALDPFPFGGGTSTCDALWMGVPVVTLKGVTAVGRGSTSILSNIGLQDLIAHSDEEYLGIASTLAGNAPHLAELREKLRDRLRCSPLMDATAFARAMEAAYRQMWRAWCSASC
jgi:predicted O-linked N-acetylglucosamine transferase (SPINDLY family)